MKRNRNYRCHDRSNSIFEPLEGRRLMSGGELDPSFSDNGKTLVELPGATITARDVAVQNDGKTVVVGTASFPRGVNRFLAVRFNVDGTLDKTFGGRSDGRMQGMMTYAPGTSHSAVADAVAIQGDGKIVVVGTEYGDSNKFAIVRLNRDGSLDKTFDGDGKKTLRVKDSSDAYDVAIQRDGKIVIVGEDYNGGMTLSGWNRNSDFAAARLHPNGSLDGTFGFLGKVTIPMGDYERAHAVAIDYTGTSTTNPNFGKIILAGSHDEFGKTFMALARLTPNGRIDGSFDRVQGLQDTGYNIDPFPGRTNSELKSILIQPDGKFVVAGHAYDDTAGSYQFALARYDANGKLDKSFGPNGNGAVETGFGGMDKAFEVVQAADGGLIVGGSVNGNLALAAYDANGKLKTSFGTGGKVKLDLGQASTGALAVTPDGRLVIAGGTAFATARVFQEKPKVQIALQQQASEARPREGSVLITRDSAALPLRVYLNIGGTATLDRDYTTNATTAFASSTTVLNPINTNNGGFGSLVNLTNNLTFNVVGNLTGNVIGGSNAGNVIGGGIGGIIGGIGGVIGGSIGGAEIMPVPYIDMAAGQKSIAVRLTTIDDSVLEPVETATFTLAPDPKYSIDNTMKSATVSIQDNDELHVNFQTSNRFPPAGHAADLGSVFGDRGAGLSFGWDVDNSAHARFRYNSGSPDARYDTLNHMHKPGGGRTWEISVPNGLYQVRLVAGDPSAADSLYAMNLEGQAALIGRPTADVRWFRSTAYVQVDDGRLTLSNHESAVNNKIAFIDIKAAPIGATPQVITPVALPVRLKTSATASQWTAKPNGLFSDKQVDEALWA